MKKRNGFTMVEVMCAIAVLAVISMFASLLLDTGIKGKTRTDTEYNVQTKMRESSDLVVDRIRYSTAVFILPESSFNKSNIETGTYLTDKWNYFGIIKDEAKGTSKVVNLVYNEKTGKHDEEVLIESDGELSLDLTFKSTGDTNVDSKQIEVSFAGYRPEQEEAYEHILTEVKALNSLQLVDYSSGSTLDPGRAIAYRDDERVSNVKARVGLVLDMSGSMAYSIDEPGYNPNVPYEQQRIYFLKDAAGHMLEKFSTNNNIDICIVPFSDTADIGVEGNYWVQFNMETPYDDDYSFLSAQDDYTDIKEYFDAMEPHSNTNTGDGLRRVYWAFEDAPEDNTVEIIEYLIVVMDGDSNEASLQYADPVVGEWNDPPYYMDRGNVIDQIDPEDELYQKNGTLFYYTSRYKWDETTQQLHFYLFGTPYLTDEATKRCLFTGSVADKLNYPTAPFTIDPFGTGYVTKTGKRLKDRGMTTYVISVAPDVSSEGMNNVIEALGVEEDNVFEAVNGDLVREYFDQVADAIINDLWFVMGPNLQP